MSRQRKVPKIWEKDPFFRHLGRQNPNTRVRKKTKKQKKQQGEEMKTRAEKIKLQIDELTKLDFYQPAAKMFSIKKIDDSEDVVKYKGDNKDVYELLESDKTIDKLKTYTEFAITTVGWAAPIQDDVSEDEMPRPSESPERMRVRLTTICMDGQPVHSVIEFEDEREPLWDTQGRGALADAIDMLKFKLGVHKMMNELGEQ